MVVPAVKYFSDNQEQPPFLKALAEVRRIGVHEGVVLPPRPSNHAGDRPVRRSCHRQSRIFLEQAPKHWREPQEL